jgi:hypothetical protein
MNMIIRLLLATALYAGLLFALYSGCMMGLTGFQQRPEYTLVNTLQALQQCDTTALNQTLNIQQVAEALLAKQLKQQLETELIANGGLLNSDIIEQTAKQQLTTTVNGIETDVKHCKFFTLNTSTMPSWVIPSMQGFVALHWFFGIISLTDSQLDATQQHASFKITLNFKELKNAEVLFELVKKPTGVQASRTSGVVNPWQIVRIHPNDAFIAGISAPPATNTP